MASQTLHAMPPQPLQSITDPSPSPFPSPSPSPSAATAAPALVLSNSGKAIDKSCKKKYVKQVTGRHNDTDIHLAAKRGDLAAVKQILGEIDAQLVGSSASAEFDAQVAEIRSGMVNEVNELGETALLEAVEAGHIEVVRELLKYSNKDSICRKNLSGFDALHKAASEGHHENLNFASEKSVLQKVKLFLFNPQSQTFVYDDVCMNLLRLTSGKRLYLVVCAGYKSMHTIAFIGWQAKDISYELSLIIYPLLKDVLLDHDPGLSKTLGPSNLTPLISAASRGHTEVVKQLLSTNSSLLEISRSNGKNALHLAARQGYVETVKALLEKDPQLARRTDKKGQTALHMAVKGDSCEVVKLLLGADAAIVMLPDKFGHTALHVATRKKRVEIVNELLVLPDANVNALNRDHKTPFDIAEGLPLSEEATEIKECLARYGAVRANELNQPRDELRKTVTQIKKDVHTQLEQTRKTNKNVHGIAKELRKLHREGINNATNSVTVVAVLFATVAFAAIFTVPGGTKDTGRAVVVGSLSFKIFFLFNAVALFTSLAVVVVQITLVRGETKAERRVVVIINKLMWLASVCTSVAFMASAYIVVGRHYEWAAILVTVIGGVIMAGVLGTMTYYVVKSKRSRSLRKKEKKLSRSAASTSWFPSEFSDSEVNPIYAL
ncbi:Ankyrin repeat-containing protein [Cinnamomum micranthum f. kanehirae]|uniref:Ankyrin repeat-containing protein n=1 Tax=Cinnamomum micranthum f. kanehirae TaxID=337451 RepID=A0A3S3Q076_9MAGN|nr:Ankyrin repeat-containing protein [Cinnamomum micranthum f. kanehirae]